MFMLAQDCNICWRTWRRAAMHGVSIQIYATADIEATKCKYDWIGVCNNRPIDFH